MAGQGRTGRSRGVLTALLALLAVAPAGVGLFDVCEHAHASDRMPPGLLPVDPMRSEVMKADARLADVEFVDLQFGWAVGDRGTIWHTEDGGRNWHLQTTAVDCSLTSVSFVDRQNGWAAGGGANPYTHTGTGVLLATSDGGRHWNLVKSLLPALGQVRFLDRKHGWAVGSSSALFPSGVFTSADGGRSWTPMTGAKTSGWRGGDFINPNTGVLAGTDGTAAVVRRGSVEPARTARFGLRGLTRVKLVPEVSPQLYGWMIGQGGLVMMTSDLGTTWQTPPGDLPDGAIGQFDFSALEVRGPKAWVAGSPGTRVFHTADAGRTWTSLSTGQNLPIRDITFVDDAIGWAVGDLGIILSTADGGRSWRRQRSGGTRAALMALLADPDDVPLELFAQLSGNDGYLGVVEVLGRRDTETTPRGDVPATDRIHQATVGVGASGAATDWRFPLSDEALKLSDDRVVEQWDRANDARGLRELEAHLVRRIRLWRPDVVLTHDADASGDDPVGQLINQSVLRAVQQAEDPTAYPEQITQAGLEPWRVSRVYAALAPGVHGTVNLTTSQLAARLGCSLADVAAGPRGLVQQQYRVSPQSLGFRTLLDKLPGNPERRDFFSGITLQPGGEARRELIATSADTLGLLQRMAQKRRNSQAILEKTDPKGPGGVGLLAQAGELTRDLDPNSAAELLYQMGQRYHREGHWPLAASAFGRIVDNYPDHPLASAALVWQVQYYASGEAAWRVEGRQRFAVTQTSMPAFDFAKAEDRREQAAEIGKQIQRTRPMLYAEPSIGFSLAVVDRARGFPRQAERFYLARRLGTSRDAWWACAQGEHWMADPQGLPPKPLVVCATATAKPRLDGRLDDAVWEHAKPAKLASARRDDRQWPAEVKLAYDREFLYLAVRCHRAPGAEYEVSDHPRPRDPDLSSEDRVDLLIDLDRDFATYYRLTVDHRGWPAESCWGDRSWNPNWFVAQESSQDFWTAEAAVPMEQLTGTFPTSRDVWAVGIQRIVPGVGFQSWNTPAEATVRPEGFGYLVFE